MQFITQAGAEEILEGQRKYFSSGRTREIAFRAEQLKKLYAGIIKYEDRLLEALKKDLGICAFEAYATEIGFVLSDISYTLKNLRRWARPKTCPSPVTLFYSKSRIIYEPYGSVLIIGPYNYPFQLVMEPLIGAVAAGNCAVICSSECTPNVSKAINELIGEIFPPEYICSLEGGRENNALLLEAGFDYIFFTGSYRVGRIVYEAAARRLIPVTLELGGKSPVLVHQSADIKTAARRIIWGKLLNAGQTCVAPDYVFAHKSVKQELLMELQNAIKEFYGEDLFHNEEYGRIVSAEHTRRLLEILRRDREYIVTGGGGDQNARYIEPAVLCPPIEAACMQEELFGPVLPVLEYQNEEEAAEYICPQPKPLALYIFSGDKAFAERMLARIPSGGACINDTVSHILNPALPFGGRGASGLGAYHGKYSFDTFSHKRSVLSKSVRIKTDAAFPPFSARKLGLIKRLMK